MIDFLNHWHWPSDSHSYLAQSNGIDLIKQLSANQHFKNTINGIGLHNFIYKFTKLCYPSKEIKNVNTNYSIALEISQRNLKKK